MNPEQKKTEYAVIIGSYSNACSIIHGLKEIGFTGEIIDIDPNVEKAKCLAEVMFPEIKEIKKKVDDLEDIIEIINRNTGKTSKKTIFMTSEECIEPIRKAIEDGRLQNTIAHTGSGVDNELIFDRFKFYQFVESLGYGNIPKTISSDNDPFEVFGEEFLIRVNKSWDGGKELPRPKVVRTKQEKEKIERGFNEAGISQNMWSYQELLSTVVMHNVSVCGWYDEAYHQFAVTRKLLEHPPNTGIGDVIEIYYDAPDSLVKETETILKALKYTGAFEMEFVLDAKSNEYKLIELNPRFWMQHGLLEKLTDYSLIRRALGETELKEIPVDEIEHMYWVSGTRALYRLAKGQLRILKYLMNGICIPSLCQAVKWALYYNKYLKEYNNIKKGE